MGAQTEREPEFIGLAFNPWDDGRSVRAVYRVHDINEARTHVRVSFIGHQHGPTLVRLPGMVPRLALWRPVTGFGSVFVGTETLVKGGTWARKRPTVRLDTLAQLTDRQLLGLDPAPGEPATVDPPATAKATAKVDPHART
jgi:hypothetical protein